MLTLPCVGHVSCKTKHPDAVLINLDTVLVKVAPWCPGFVVTQCPLTVKGPSFCPGCPLAHVSTLVLILCGLQADVALFCHRPHSVRRKGFL